MVSYTGWTYLPIRLSTWEDRTYVRTHRSHRRLLPEQSPLTHSTPDTVVRRRGGRFFPLADNGVSETDIYGSSVLFALLALYSRSRSPVTHARSWRATRDSVGNKRRLPPFLSEAQRPRRLLLLFYIVAADDTRPRVTLYFTLPRIRQLHSSRWKADRRRDSVTSRRQRQGTGGYRPGKWRREAGELTFRSRARNNRALPRVFRDLRRYARGYVPPSSRFAAGGNGCSPL